MELQPVGPAVVLDRQLPVELPGAERMVRPGQQQPPPTIKHFFDLAGNITETIDQVGGHTMYEFDDLGRLEKVTQPDPLTGAASGPEWIYQYNKLSQLSHATDPEDRLTSYEYDSRARLLTVREPDPDGAGVLDRPATTYTYDLTGNLASVIDPLGNVTQHYYDPLNQLTQTIEYGWPATSYTYDAVGNIKQIRDDIASETSIYGYDTLDRLTSWTLNGGAPETYSYDADGNLDVKAGVDLNYNDAAHVHAVTSVGSNTYQYDQNGNQTTRIIGSDTFALIYDAENRLVEVKKNSVTMATFVYDGDGKRVKSIFNSTLTTYFVGTHYEVANGVVTKYYFAGAQRVAMRTGSMLYYLLGDHLGSTSLTADASGQVVSELRYTAWGEVRYASGDTPTKYQFTGQYSYVGEFGLHFYNARWYDSYLGRFAQADTIIPPGVQGLDRYAYVNNSPLVYTDPSGHNWQCGPDGIFCSNDFEEAYGIEFIGTWTAQQKAYVRIAVKATAAKWNLPHESDSPDRRDYRRHCLHRPVQRKSARRRQ